MECAPAFRRGSVRNLVIPPDPLPARILIRGRGLGMMVACIMVAHDGSMHAGSMHNGCKHA